MRKLLAIVVCAFLSTCSHMPAMANEPCDPIEVQVEQLKAHPNYASHVSLEMDRAQAGSDQLFTPGTVPGKVTHGLLVRLHSGAIIFGGVWIETGECTAVIVPGNLVDGLLKAIRGTGA